MFLFAPGYWVTADTESRSHTSIFLVLGANFKYIKAIKINPMYMLNNWIALQRIKKNCRLNTIYLEVNKLKLFSTALIN